MLPLAGRFVKGLFANCRRFLRGVRGGQVANPRRPAVGKLRLVLRHLGLQQGQRQASARPARPQQHSPSQLRCGEGSRPSLLLCSGFLPRAARPSISKQGEQQGPPLQAPKRRPSGRTPAGHPQQAFCTKKQKRPKRSFLLNYFIHFRCGFFLTRFANLQNPR